MAKLREGEWSCYRGAKFNGGNGQVTEVVSLMEGMVMLRRWLG